MLNNREWKFANNSYTMWCRIKAENEMARCCGIENFEAGTAEACGVSTLSGNAQQTQCATNCYYTMMINLCNNYFGKACYVDRKIYNSVPLRVSEVFCVPKDCDNDSDRQSLIAWYSTLYAGRLNGWHANWNDAILNCPSVAVAAVLYTLLAMVIVALLLPITYCLFVAPKDRGRTLISQADMQAESTASTQDLRGVAAGGDALGQSGMSMSR